jgi:hypothetical protein
MEIDDKQAGWLSELKKHSNLSLPDTQRTSCVTEPKYFTTL